MSHPLPAIASVGSSGDIDLEAAPRRRAPEPRHTSYIRFRTAALWSRRVTFAVGEVDCWTPGVIRSGPPSRSRAA
jgi:hypothetical protein